MAGMAPGAASSGAGSLRQGSMPAPSSSYNPSVDLFTMINRQEGGSLVNGNGFTPQPPIGTMKQMPMSVDNKAVGTASIWNGGSGFSPQPPVGALEPNSLSSLDTAKAPRLGTGVGGGKQEISLHDMTEFPALGMQHKGMAQKEQMLRLTQDEFPTLSSAGYKNDGLSSSGHLQDVPNDQPSEAAVLSMNPQFHPQNGGYGTTSTGSASGKNVVHGQAFPQMGIRSATPPMGSSQQYEPFMPHLRLPQPKTPPVPDRFGLLGLLSVIRMTDPDLNTLALGTDLTTLGLNLNSPDCLYESFSSPFANGPSRKEPEFYLPTCYYMQPPIQPAESKVHLFSDETLIYAFYALPRDLLQATAAVELYNRDWRFHKTHQLWFIRLDSEPVTKANGYERGTYIFFDIMNWKKVKKENFILHYEQIAELPKLVPFQPIGPPGGNSNIISPAQALNQHPGKDTRLNVQARSNRRFEADA